MKELDAPLLDAWGDLGGQNEQGDFLAFDEQPEDLHFQVGAKRALVHACLLPARTPKRAPYPGNHPLNHPTLAERHTRTHGSHARNNQALLADRLANKSPGIGGMRGSYSLNDLAVGL